MRISWHSYFNPPVTFDKLSHVGGGEVVIRRETFIKKGVNGVKWSECGWQITPERVLAYCPGAG